MTDLKITMKQIALFCMMLFCLLMIPGCSGSSTGSQTAAVQTTSQVSESRELFAMDTYMTLTAYGDQAAAALDEAESEILALDELLSTGNRYSEISHLNESGEIHLSEVSSYLTERSLEVSELSSGAFNPMIYPLMEAWGFTDQQYRVPTQEEIDELLSLTDLSQVIFDPSARQISFLQEGMKIDFGGIAKGYTSQRISEICSRYGVSSAVFSLGGNVQVLGSKPDGSMWKIAIRDPIDSNAFLGILSVADKAVITSGGYERYFEENGVTYHHILDPSNGYPAQNGLISVTIISGDGTLADGLSTALYVAGLEKAKEIWRNNSDRFDAIFMSDDGTVAITEGIEGQFTSDYTVQVIHKEN